MFASVALAKGCHVWVFEPTPFLVDIFERNLQLSGNEYTLFPYAVADKSGEMFFSVNNNFEKDMDYGHNTLVPNKSKTMGVISDTLSETFIFDQKDYSKIAVQSVTLDDYVTRNGIQKIDFIKADIEGAERYMLMGAKQVLKEFAPKLSLCTYHLPDDPQVMENLILEANPNYVIEHKWSKLYAYCPER